MARKLKVKFPEPNLTPEEKKVYHCLGKKYGGEVACRSYCTMYEAPPLLREVNLLCSGGGIWPPCPDLDLCRRNAWHMPWVRRSNVEQEDETTLPVQA